jgi:PPOX class probable F420-dependent enzyme
MARRYPLARPLDEDLDARLRSERILWLGTTGADGRPHLVPTWFWWDGSSFLLFSKPEARKVRNLRANRSVMLAAGDPEDDFDVQLVEGDAELLDEPTETLLPADLATKYADQLRELALDLGAFARTYSQAIRIAPTRFLGWTGRSRLPEAAAA